MINDEKTYELTLEDFFVYSLYSLLQTNTNDENICSHIPLLQTNTNGNIYYNNEISMKFPPKVFSTSCPIFRHLFSFSFKMIEATVHACLSLCSIKYTFEISQFVFHVKIFYEMLNILNIVVDEKRIIFRLHNKNYIQIDLLKKPTIQFCEVYKQNNQSVLVIT